MTKKPIFSPIANSRLSDEAVRQIRSLIETGVLKPGDRLPPERELREQFSVSRTSIREALRILEALGFIEVQPGVGAFVINHGVGADLPKMWMEWLAENQEVVNDLLEIREALEPKAAALAAAEISQSQIQALFQTLETMEQCAQSSDIDGAVQADIAFHDLISKATRNYFLIELNDSINYALIESRYAYFQSGDNILASCRQHRAVAEALERGDPQESAEAMRQHVQKTKVAMRRVTASERPADI